MSSILNQKGTRQFVLDYAAKSRAHPFTRVSQEFLDQAEADFKAMLRRRVDSHPSKGVTLK